MSITLEKKQEVIKSFQKDDKDTGSADVQIAILTERINNLSTHMQEHKKDFGGRRGLLALVARRRKLLDYVKANDEPRYQDLIKRLGIRR